MKVKSSLFRTVLFSISLVILIGCASTPKLNSRASLGEEDFQLYEQPEPDKYSIFVRIYNPKYKNPLCSGSILQKGIAAVETKPIVANHVAIGFDLDDNFYGVTLYSEPQLKIEKCSDISSNEYMSVCKDYASVQSTYAIAVTENEYSKAKRLIDKCVQNDCIQYDVGQNFYFAKRGIKEKALRIRYPEGDLTHCEVKNKKKEKFQIRTIDYDEKNYFVCSSFAAWVLVNSVESVRSYFVQNHINCDQISPTDIVSIPGLKLIFSSTWDNYFAAIDAMDCLGWCKNKS